MCLAGMRRWSGAVLLMVLNDRAAFLFTVMNPYVDPPALFPSKGDGWSMVSRSTRGPIFGRDLYVTGEFNRHCSSDIGVNYVNAPRRSGHRAGSRTLTPAERSGHIALTGARYFTPAEVEVWGMA